MPTQWSFDEVAILTAHFEEHGTKWPEWESLLPGRTSYAIERKARGMGLQTQRSKTASDKWHKRRERTVSEVIGARLTRDPEEGYVREKMEQGLAPSQIDAIRKWPPGRSAKILAQSWERMSDKGDV